MTNERRLKMPMPDLVREPFGAIFLFDEEFIFHL